MLLPGEELFLRLFFQMSTCRNYAGGPIPWDLVSKVSYAWEFSRDMRIAFGIIIRKMDEAFLEWHDEDAKRKAKLNREEQTGPIGKFAQRIRRRKSG